MLGIRIATLSGAIAAYAMSAVAVHAFEQQGPAAPAPSAPIVVPAEPALSPGEREDDATPDKKGRGLKLPGIGKISVPKLNFGLDLMYGSTETSDTELGFSSDPVEDDVTIMGKVKRRF